MIPVPCAQSDTDNGGVQQVGLLNSTKLFQLQMCWH